MIIKRNDGEEQPCIKLGIFKLRIPFIHYKWEWPEAMQGLLLVAVAMGAIPALQETLGASFEVALTMMVLNGILYMLHPTFGDPVFPGWITPALPLVLGYAAGFAEGVDRIHAIISLQIVVGIIFTLMGITGMADKLIKHIPVSLRGGIILGAGIAALYDVVGPGGRMVGNEITVLVGALICSIVLFSWKFNKSKDKNRFLKEIGKYGMIPGFIVAIIIGPLVGEIAAPEIQMGLVPLKFKELIEGYTVFGIPGFPPISYFIKAIPLAIASYIVGFGNFIIAEVVLDDAHESRPDEKVDFSGNRSNIISGIRNIIMGLIAPYAPLNGPIWAAGTISVVERYKQGRKSMDSIFGGMGSYAMAMALAGIALPIITFLRPVLSVGLALTLIIQGYACAYISMDMLKTKEERGVAGIMAIFLAFRGATWGLIVGLILHVAVCSQSPIFRNKKVELNQNI